VTRSDNIGDIRLWLIENTEGLQPAEAEKARTEIERHIADVVRDRLANVPANPAEQGAYYEALHDLVADLPPETREDLDLLISADERMAKDAVRMCERAGRLKYHSPARWLEFATKGICQEGKERIRDEISAHYEDSLHDALQQGVTQIAAHIAAMESLGDPNKAAKGFRRSYLTEKEAEWLGQAKAPMSGRFSVGVYWFVLYCGFGLGLRAVDEVRALLGFVGFASSIVLYVWVMRRVAPHAARSGRFRVYYLLRCLVMLPLPMFAVLTMQFGGQMSARHAVLVDACVLICLALLFLVVSGKTDRKLRSVPPKRRP